MGFGETLHGGPVNSAELQRVREALLFEGDERNYKLVRFSALLLLSAAIATFGLLGDSVATVISAMIGRQAGSQGSRRHSPARHRSC